MICSARARVALFVAMASMAVSTSLAPPVWSAAAQELPQERAGPTETVILLHGLGRSPLSMWPLEGFLEERGYRVVNIGYPSTSYPIADLARLLGDRLDECCSDSPGPIHFVTHSMGGILVRAYLAEHSLDSLGRVVMLSPPNRGSKVVDQVSDWEFFEQLFGPAARELGTDSSSVPRSLPPVDFELGIIAGSRSLNPFSAAWLEGPNDGTVAVESTRVEGVQDFLVLPRSHSFIIWSFDVMEQVVAFLQTGAFGSR